MAQIEAYQPNQVGSEHQAVSTGRVYDQQHQQLHFRELNEFPKGDPWHVFFEQVIRNEAVKGSFSNQIILEGGIGVGSLMLEVAFATQDAFLPPPKHIIGVDINPVALDLAFDHLQQIGLGGQTELWYAGIVQFLQQQETIPATVGVFCIPQVPDPFHHRKKQALRMSDSDSYDPAFVPREFTERYNDVGLALIAATLSELHRVAPEDFTAYVIISGRVPLARRDAMIAEMGWTVEEEFRTREPIQQDPDTKLDAYLHTANHSPEERFFERLDDGSFRPISIEEAVRRTREEGASRQTLDVYHHLSIVRLRKRQITYLNQ